MSSNVPPHIRNLIDHTPIVYLDEHEQYFPCSIRDFLNYVTPFHHEKPIKDAEHLNLTLNNLDALNAFGDQGRDIFLTSRDDPSKYPSWLHGCRPSKEGASACVVPIVLVDKIVQDDAKNDVRVTDMFSFYFYNFNAGPRLPSDPSRFFGDHVGDLEYTMIRFEADKPKMVYLSRHASGTLYDYDSLEKQGIRPVVFAGRGTHALYGIEGNHQYIMPDDEKTEILDYTSRGIFWDPSHNLVIYSFDMETGDFRAIHPADAPTSWLKFNGFWGDQEYGREDPRQGTVCKQSRWGDGPDFISRKNLGRIDVSQHDITESLANFSEPCEHPSNCLRAEKPFVLVKQPWGT
ncbi:uncharacterized protein EI97DRAFT_425984 [Westerdykella ornata]|uniref:Vacuolar protein sorting-associated protein 62 n=1 Tax=Westerdykella ornata TaxID=318751 RepID=A0A6A6J951_WESOR|nr:uncharacterized protein EI97DRAFT_425984 [Westerdykella ornata]KAF2272703.1 hypothetical protein EI97DRAFT_425984 [Westerdykella ornata]